MTNLDNIKKESAIAALNKMMQSGYFSICTIDNIAQMFNINPKCEEYDILHTIHCVQFSDMSPLVRNSIPDLIAKCLSNQNTLNCRFDSINSTYRTEPTTSKLLRLFEK